MAIATSENILKLMYSYNIWWRDGSIPESYSKPIKRFAYYEALKSFMHRELRRYVVISGARRVGKTTILYQIMKYLLENNVNPRNILYLSFDNPLLKFTNMEEIMTLYMNNVSMGEDVYLLFDEIQYASDWEKWLKVFYDTRPRWRVCATGSASPVLEHGINESGVGRWSVISVPTLSFYEYCELVGVEKPKLDDNIIPTSLAKLETKELNKIFNKISPLQKQFNRYLTVGGFPELALSQDDFYSQRMLREDVVDKILKRDIPSLFNIRNPAVLEKVFLYLCYCSSNIINFTTMSKELDNTSIATLQDYVEHLRRSNLIYQSMPINLDGKKVLKAKPKIYIADAALRNAVLMLDNVVTDSEEMGIMVETAIYKHVATFYYRNRERVGYFRQTAGKAKEIDIVVEGVWGKILLEVKYREQSKIKKDDAIITMPTKKDKAFIITKNPTDFGIVENIKGQQIVKIPAFAFLYLLGHAEKIGYFRV